MLSVLGLKSIEDLVDKTIPSNIRMKGDLKMVCPLERSSFSL